jgi:hypothetical protein
MTCSTGCHLPRWQRQVAEELTVRESMIFLDRREFIGEPPGCALSSEPR